MWLPDVWTRKISIHLVLMHWRKRFKFYIPLFPFLASSFTEILFSLCLLKSLLQLQKTSRHQKNTFLWSLLFIYKRLPNGIHSFQLAHLFKSRNPVAKQNKHNRVSCCGKTRHQYVILLNWQSEIIILT